MIKFQIKRSCFFTLIHKSNLSTKKQQILGNENSDMVHVIVTQGAYKPRSEGFPPMLQSFTETRTKR